MQVKQVLMTRPNFCVQTCITLSRSILNISLNARSVRDRRIFFKVANNLVSRNAMPIAAVTPQGMVTPK